MNDNDKMQRDRNGSLYDRGMADSYYDRAPRPHWYPSGTYSGLKMDTLTPEDVAEYMAGYDENEKNGDKKDYG